MASTSTNKQPLLVDRPLFDSVRVTTQTAGSQANNTVFVQGGQAPAILVDMDAELTDDTNNGGIVDAIQITRDDFYRAPDQSLTSATTGSVVSLTSGEVILVSDSTWIGTGTSSGYGYYTYTGSTLTGTLGSFTYTAASGFNYEGVEYDNRKAVTFVFYATRGTTTPIPASGDYKVLFSKTVPAGTNTVDCSDIMPEVAVPAVHVGNTNGLENKAPLRNKGIYLEKGDRIYVGVFPDGPNISGYTNGAHVTAQGGFF